MTSLGVLAEIEARAAAIHPLLHTDAEDTARQIVLHATKNHRELHRVKECPFPLAVLVNHRGKLVDLASLVVAGIAEADRHITLLAKGSPNECPALLSRLPRPL